MRAGALASATILAAIVGCSDLVQRDPVATNPTGIPTNAVSTGTPTPLPSITVAPSVEAGIGECGPAPVSMATDIDIMRTEWGPAYCLVPATFPEWPRSEIYEAVDGPPASAVRLATGRADTVARWYMNALEADGFSVESTPQIERGKDVVIEFIGPMDPCRVQIAIAWGVDDEHPYAFVSVLYGTGCPSP